MTKTAARRLATATKRRVRAAKHSRAGLTEASAVVIKRVANRRRRARCEADVFLWLRTYIPAKFRLPFSDDQKAMAQAILDALVIGGDQAVAGPRAGGKSSITEGVLSFCVAKGLVKFAVIIGSNGKQAKDRIANIKKHFDRERMLAEDYPEICGPVWALENRLQRCASQHIDNERTNIRWTDHEIAFPEVAGSKASGSIIMAAGIDAAMCGMNIGAMRPDLVILDDIDRDWSPTETAKYEDVIEKDIAGLGGPDTKLARVFLGTIPDRRCNAYKFTDPTLKPSWKGKRFRSIIEWPTRMDLWDEYVRLWVENQETDPTARIAHKFYLGNRAEMDLGAVLSNPYRMKHTPLGDGTREEESALQSCYNFIARFGMASFLSEHQNDPPAEAQPEGSGITDGIVAHRLNNRPQRIVPPGTDVITAAIDVGKWQIHWGVVPWQRDATGCVIDYATRPVYPEGKSDEAIERAIIRDNQRGRESFFELS